ncbi:MAG: hypothetical protein MJ000_01850 [Bacteroidales bacterium]|nr:hypothetical protein [Bacteroidales bacterium]
MYSLTCDRINQNKVWCLLMSTTLSISTLPTQGVYFPDIASRPLLICNFVPVSRNGAWLCWGATMRGIGWRKRIFFLVGQLPVRVRAARRAVPQ